MEADIAAWRNPSHHRRRARLEGEIEGLLSRVSILIARLDRMDGDPDLEEPDLEDSFLPAAYMNRWSDGPGCSISDPKGQDDEDGVNTGVRKFWLHGVEYSGAGCPISDPGELANRQCPTRTGTRPRG